MITKHEVPKHTVIRDGVETTYDIRPIRNVRQLRPGMEVIFVQEDDTMAIWEIQQGGDINDLRRYYADDGAYDFEHLKKFWGTITY